MLDTWMRLLLPPPPLLCPSPPEAAASPVTVRFFTPSAISSTTMVGSDLARRAAAGVAGPTGLVDYSRLRFRWLTSSSSRHHQHNTTPPPFEYSKLEIGGGGEGSRAQNPNNLHRLLTAQISEAGEVKCQEQMRCSGQILE